MPAKTDNGQDKRRVVLIDEQTIVRAGLAQLLSQEEDLTVVAEPCIADEAMQGIAAAKPDIVVMDISLRSASGIDLIKDIHNTYPSLPILVLSAYDESIYAERVLRAGAQGYIMKHEPAPVVLNALRRCLRGEISLSERMASEILHRLAGRRGTAAPTDISDLSDRELEIFQMLGKGMRVREIAAKLYLSVKTIEAHREHIKQKLNLKSSNELLRYAFHVMSAS